MFNNILLKVCMTQNVFGDFGDLVVTLLDSNSSQLFKYFSEYIILFLYRFCSTMSLFSVTFLSISNHKRIWTFFRYKHRTHVLLSVSKVLDPIHYFKTWKADQGIINARGYLHITPSFFFLQNDMIYKKRIFVYSVCLKTLPQILFTITTQPISGFL